MNSPTQFRCESWILQPQATLDTPDIEDDDDDADFDDDEEPLEARQEPWFAPKDFGSPMWWLRN